MNKRTKQLQSILAHALPWLALAFLLLYTYAKFMEHSYAGFRADVRGNIYAVYVQDAEPVLLMNDRIIQVGPIDWDDFQSDLRKRIFEGAQIGDIVPIVIERAGQRMTINWRFAGPSRGEIVDLVFSEGWLAFVFWLAGTLTFLHLRPKDERWRLLIAFNYLTAIWLSLGSGVSAYHIWESAILLRMVIWLSVPVYLHLHWVFPRTLGKLPKWIVWGGYATAAMLAAAQWFQFLPNSFYLVGFLFAVVGMLGLLIAHAILQAETRRDFRLLLVVALLALAPSVAVGLIGTFSHLPTWFAGIALLSLPLLPFAYFYAAFRRQLVDLEVRVNRIISSYIFMVLLGIFLLPLIALADIWFHSPVATFVIGFTAAAIAAISAMWGFPSFQILVERRLLGIPFPPQNLQETYSARITTSASLPNLLRLIGDEILPSLLIREFVFLQFHPGPPAVLFTAGLAEEQIPTPGYDFSNLLATAGKYRPLDFQSRDLPDTWVRLALPLKLENELIGLWLLGRHDPDDIYSQAEIASIQSLANQTVIALSNILQTQQLRVMYQADINRHEDERLHLALDLHDSVLNQMAVLLMKLDSASISPGFQEAYDVLTERVREIISDLRPAMLNYGLKPALEELADNLMERSNDTVNVLVEVEADEGRCPPNIEQHLFRIVQQACENALRHGQARKIHIFGQLYPQRVKLSIEDYGIGFKAGEGLDLHSLLANKHFGLAGMVERAELIGAEIVIRSTPMVGTQIHVTWNSDPAKIGEKR